MTITPFLHEETEAQRRAVACLKSQSWASHGTGYLLPAQVGGMLGRSGQQGAVTVCVFLARACAAG